ncbi:MAG: SH3 domain-containing protein [Alphaproteobacteria bacterium]|nr:SH3 domain-containing protein [Alphaproteobacteria bacterium]
MNFRRHACAGGHPSTDGKSRKWIPAFAGMTLVIVCLALCSGLANAASENDDEGLGASGLPLPRFASLRSNEVNMRTGPGTRYPIEWVFTRHGLPVEITAEYEIWRRIRDPDGSEGWVHKSNLSGRRMAIVTGKGRELRRDDNPQSPITAHLETGAMGQILSCKPEWCRLKFEGAKGYLPKSDFWGTYADEVFN